MAVATGTGAINLATTWRAGGASSRAEQGLDSWPSFVKVVASVIPSLKVTRVGRCLCRRIRIHVSVSDAFEVSARRDPLAPSSHFVAHSSHAVLLATPCPSKNQFRKTQEAGPGSGVVVCRASRQGSQEAAGRGLLGGFGNVCVRRNALRSSLVRRDVRVVPRTVWLPDSSFHICLVCCRLISSRTRPCCPRCCLAFNNPYPSP